MLLTTVLIIEILLLSAGIIAAGLSRDKHIGLIGCLFTIILETVLCLVLIYGKAPKLINAVFSLHYCLTAWFLFFMEILICDLNTKRRFVFYKSPVLYLSLISTGFLIYDMKFGGVLSSKKHIFLGSNWWVVEIDTGLRGDIFLFVLSAATIYILGLLVVEYFHSAKLFRSRAVEMIIALVLLSAADIIAYLCLFPAWIMTLLTGGFAAALFYWVLHYANSRLIKDSLLSFANNLSEGFILYDSNDQLLYINDLFSRLLTEEQLKQFASKKAFERWTDDMEDVKGIFVKKLTLPNARLYVRIYEHPIQDGNVYLGIFYNLKDITDSILQIESMEQINEELAQTARMKSDFLANMSHEIRTPMNAVIGMAEMALRENLPPRALGYVNQIKSSGHNLLNIINDILDYSKIESGKMDIILDEYEPASEYQDIANTLATRIGDKDIELIVNLDPAIPYKLEGDAMRIRQVLINLANNAIKFTNQGQVCINVTFDRIAEDQINMHVHVVDSGIGIREEDLKKLFVSFQQVNSKRNRSIEGTGLGLAISKKLVEAMGGTIGLSSEYGKGSDFFFEIPQKIIDNTPSMQVENRDSVIVLGAFQKENIREVFMANMNALGLTTQLLEDPADYETAYQDFVSSHDGSHCFIFFDKTLYGNEMRTLLEEHPEAEGVILVDFDSFFTADQQNLRVVRRPFTTLALSLILNNKALVTENRREAFSFDFVAPEATILIVDDSEINITVARGLLDPLDMEIHTAPSGKVAIEMVSAIKYDIIFMDHMMPEMDGIETVQYIRKHLPQAEDTPIIALTANAVSGAKEMFLKNGMNDFVSKPIELKELVSKVKQWLPQEKIIKNKTIVTNQDTDNETVQIPGLDCEAAIKLTGSAVLYKKVAFDYLKRIDSNYAGILKCFENEDWPNYTVKVHALKSSSRQIGAMELGLKAEKLEKAGHHNDVDYIMENTGELLQEYRNVQQILNEYYGAAVKKEESRKDLDSTYVKELLDALKTGCDDLDMDALESVGSELVRFHYNEEQKLIVDQILEAIARMDVDLCMEKTDALLELL